MNNLNITDEGFDLHFTQPMDEGSLRDTANYHFRHYFYEYHLKYGSDQFDVQKVHVKNIEVSDGGKKGLTKTGKLEARLHL